jgi:hypothetical protein
MSGSGDVVVGLSAGKSNVVSARGGLSPQFEKHSKEFKCRVVALAQALAARQAKRTNQQQS